MRDLARDAAGYAPFGGWYRSLGFWVVATHRLGAWARTLPQPLRLPILVVYGLLRMPWRFFLHVELPASARLGPGLLLVHPYNVLMGADVQLGEDCAIYHEVTLGAGPKPGMPQIGNRVALFAGARVLGGVCVGDGAEIGANCVVMTDVPAGSIVAPTPCRAIPKTLVRVAKESAAGR
jgi:serine O-acetyltransferase